MIVVYVLSAYALVVIWLVIARHRAMTHARRALVDGRFRDAINLLWAWASPDELRAAHHRWGEGVFEGMLLQPYPRQMRLYYPHVAPVACAVLLYQAFLRPGHWHGPGPCPATPNCSNYFLGCLRRHTLRVALAKGTLRYQNCSGFDGISYHETMM